MRSNTTPTLDMERARELYLLHLTDKLTPDESQELVPYLVHPDCKKLFSDLQEIYSSTDFKMLLKVRPTSFRWAEIAELALTNAEIEDRRREMRIVRRISVIVIAIVLTAFLLSR